MPRQAATGCVPGLDLQPIRHIREAVSLRRGLEKPCQGSNAGAVILDNDRRCDLAARPLRERDGIGLTVDVDAH